MGKVLVMLLLFVSSSLAAQIGGESTYGFLSLTNSARVAALGGNNVSIQDRDLNMAYHNPGLLNDTMHQSIVINMVPYMNSINYGYVGYAHHIDELGTFAVGIQNINYGEFTRTDDYNTDLGSFHAAEFAIYLTYARKLSPKMSMGISIKPIISNFESYSSYGLATDLGFSYFNKEKNFSFGAVLKNLGTQITQYEDTQEGLPTDFQLGISKKLTHAPFCFSLTAKDLLSWDLIYEENNNLQYTSESNTTEGDAGFGNNVLRHLIFGLEFMPSKNFYLNGGYNHRVREELGFANKMSTVGFSWGLGFRISKFHFDYGSGRYHLGGSSNHFSISTNLSDF